MTQQRFEIGFAMNTWDFGAGTLEDGFACLRDLGFRTFEALVGDSLTFDQARLYHQVGDLRLPVALRDIDLLARLSAFSLAETTFGLRVSSLYVNPHWIEPLLWSHELDLIRAIGRFLRGCGASVLVAGGGPPARTGRTTPDDYRAFARALTEAGKEVAEIGLRLAYHPHLDCFVESCEELDRLMDVLDSPDVWLCLDPAHLQATGGDPVFALRTYVDRVAHVHLKDWDGDSAATGRARYAFRTLGEGAVDLEGFVGVLLETGYSGDAIIEIDALEVPAEQSCRDALAYVTGTLGLVPVPAP
ncbi:MAG: sugar phosphate isomerase/epimerase [Gaiellales bacterium]